VVDGTTADARFERLLHVLPAASRDGGAGLADLAAALGTNEKRILEDIEQVTARAYYHPGGWPDDVQIMIEPDRVRVTHAGGMTRPVQLTRMETLCLALALRGSVASTYLSEPAEREMLMRRSEAHLGQGSWTEEEAPSVAAPHRAPDPEGIRETLITATRDHRPCAIHYVKGGATDGTLRVIHPYAMAYGEGAWYTVGHCLVEDEVRVFRVDRVLAADHTDGAFQTPDDFDASAYLTDGKIYHGTGEREVRVRYSPRISRWVRERAAFGAAAFEDAAIEEESDGSVVVRHRVADPHWVVGHALQYGAEAEILEPEEFRVLVRGVAEGLVG
jgi:predicted DNA-binding transcriptional regulator YafY